jgi:putative SOS response-associated peptidase YedK
VCGRYRLSRRKQIIEEHFDSISGEEGWIPRYNIAPTQPVPIIRQNPKEPVRQLSLVRWGLIPSWAKDASGAATMINARSETSATKPAFHYKRFSSEDRFFLGIAPVFETERQH